MDSGTTEAIGSIQERRHGRGSTHGARAPMEPPVRVTPLVLLFSILRWRQRSDHEGGEGETSHRCGGVSSRRPHPRAPSVVWDVDTSLSPTTPAQRCFGCPISQCRGRHLAGGGRGEDAGGDRRRGSALAWCWWCQRCGGSGGRGVGDGGGGGQLWCRAIFYIFLETLRQVLDEALRK